MVQCPFLALHGSENRRRTFHQKLFCSPPTQTPGRDVTRTFLQSNAGKEESTMWQGRSLIICDSVIPHNRPLVCRVSQPKPKKKSVHQRLLNSVLYSGVHPRVSTLIQPSSGAPLPYKVLLRRNRSLKKRKKKKKKKKNPMVLNHGNTMGTGLLTAPSRLYLNFFFACGAIFPFLLRKKGFDV